MGMMDGQTRRAFVAASGLLGTLGLLGLLVRCSTDPRTDQPVTVITTCDETKLSTSASSPESTVRAYVDVSTSLVQKTQELQALMKDGCNAVNAELALPVGGDMAAACLTLYNRINAVVQAQPPPPPGPPPAKWFNLALPSSCHVDPNARATCVATCNAGGCDNSKCNPPNRLIGKCDGTCIGTCGVPLPDGGPCVGSCSGACANMAPNLCLNECVGSCLFNSFTGFCANACLNGFNGQCGGTCTGLCDGKLANNGLDGGFPEAGFPTDAGAPTNADGNCAGKCIGQCSSNGYGACSTPCGGPVFKGGVCGGACGGVCIAGTTGVGCSGTCNGSCISPTGDAGIACTGTCTGACQGTVSNGICLGTLNCGQNRECNNACEASALAATKCDEPPVFELESVSDIALYNALKKVGGKLATAIQLEAALRSALQFVDSRTTSDFAAIGASGETSRACVAQGAAAIVTAQTNVLAITTADPTRTKTTN